MKSSTENFDFVIGDAEASNSTPLAAGQLKKGSYILIKDKPCKITEYSTAAPGKHGHSKCTIVGYDIFTHKKMETILPSHHIAFVPIVTKYDYTLLDINEEGYCSLLSDTSDTREDIKLPLIPDGLASEIRQAYNNGEQVIITLIRSMDYEQIVSFKSEDKNS